MALDIKSALDALKIDTAQGITLATLRTAWIAQIKPIHPDKAQNDAERKQFTEQAQIYNKANDTLINAITKLAQMHGQEPSQYVANFASVSQEQVKSIDLDFIIEWLQKSLKQRQDAEQADASISPDCAYAFDCPAGWRASAY
jgi:hypothetical protein